MLAEAERGERGEARAAVHSAHASRGAREHGTATRQDLRFCMRTEGAVRLLTARGREGIAPDEITIRRTIL